MTNSTKELLALIVSAIAGALIISLTCWPDVEPLTQPSFEGARAGSLENTDPSCNPTNLAKLKLNLKAERAEFCAQAEQHRLDTNDLIQQTRAADAAVAQVKLAGQATWLSFVQTLGGFLTLVAAGAAAWYARQAADAAKKTYDHQKESSAHVDRPWLCLDVTVCEDLELVGNETYFKVDVQVHNIGTRPAHRVTTWIEIYQGVSMDLLDQARARVEAAIEQMQLRARPDVRTVLPNRSIVVRAPQELTLAPRMKVRAIAYTKYELPSGDEAYTWEAFEYEVADATGARRPIRSNDALIPKDDMRVRRVGLTHSE